MEENIFNKILNYFNTLEDTLRYDTSRYIGFKVRGKTYCQLTEKDEYYSVLLKRKYVSQDEIDTLEISLSNFSVWKNYAELRIPKLEDIRQYLNIIHKSYSGTKDEYDSKIQRLIDDAFESQYENIASYSTMNEYGYEELLNIWDEFLGYEIKESELNIIKSQMLILDKYNYNNLISIYINHKIIYNFMKIIFNLITYLHKNILNIVFSENKIDREILMEDYIKDEQIIESLICYKKYYDITMVSDFTRNLIIYLSQRESNIPVLTTSILLRFAKNIYPDKKLEENYELLNTVIGHYLNQLNIPIANEENRGIIYSKIILTHYIICNFYMKNNYFKIQPYKEGYLQLDEIELNLEKNFIISKDKVLKIKSCTNNIFYAVKDDYPLFLGIFIDDAEEIDNGFLRRSFKVLSITGRDSNGLPNDKYWGNFPSNNTIIPVLAEDKELFEQTVLMNLFGYDSESLISKIQELSQWSESSVATIRNSNYYEEEYTTKTSTALNLILYGVSGTGKTYHTVNYAVSIVENVEVEVILKECKNNRNYIYSRYKRYIGEKRIVFITFHENYSYEQFINNIFKVFSQRATLNRKKNYVIVIDEINRGDISKIFGELITVIDEDKRIGRVNEATVTLASNEIFSVPENLYIIGTMSPFHKSKEFMDISLRRRFDFIAMSPDYEAIPKFEEVLKPINTAIFERKKSTDYLIGQGIFINKSIKDLEGIVNKNLIPLLSHYFDYDDREVKKIFENAGIEVGRNKNTLQLEYIKNITI